MDSDAYYRVLGSAIRGARERAGLTQDELARGVGLSRTSVTNIEAGRQRLLVDQLEAIARTTRTPAVDLLPRPEGPTQQMVSGQLSEGLCLSPAVAQFLSSLSEGGGLP